MDFTIIDYSAAYFTTIGEKPIPVARGGTFVQLVNHSASNEYLILSPHKQSEYHANIVERFCLLKGNIKGRYNVSRDFFEIQDPDWEVIGGGLWEIDEEKKSLTLAGGSKAYGKFDGGRLKSRIKMIQGISSPITINCK
jgi:hypothetical protein